MQRFLLSMLLLLALCGAAFFFLFQTTESDDPMGESTLVEADAQLSATDDVAKAGAPGAEEGVEVATGLVRSVQEQDADATNGAKSENTSYVHARLVDEQGHAISGSYLSAITPQSFGEGVLLSVGQSGGQDVLLSEDQSDGNGVIHLEVPSNMPLHLRSRGDFWAPQSFELAALQPWEELDLGTLTMASADTLMGQVVDPNGKPVTNASIDLVESGSSIMSGSAVNRRATTDASGMYWIRGVPAGIYRLHAFSKGFSPAIADPVVVNGRGDIQDVALQLGSGRTVTGVVLDIDNRPIEGATVSPNRGFLSVSFSDIDDFGTDQGADGTLTNAQGEFRMTGLDENLNSVVVRGHGFAAQRPTVPETGEDLVVHLERSLTFSGKVVDAKGKPVAEAEINLKRKNDFDFEGPLGSLRSSKKTKADGTFEITGLRAGEFFINAYAPFGQITDSPLSLAEDVTGRTIHLEVARHLVVLVSNSSGDPVADASVAVQPVGLGADWGEMEFGMSHDESMEQDDGEGESTRTRISSFTSSIAGITDVFGRAVLYGVPSGAYDLIVKADDYADRTITLERVEDAQEEEVILSVASQLIVLAMTPEEVSLPGVDIYLKPLDREGEVFSQTSDATGRAVWPRLESGRYEVGYREAKAQSGGGMTFAFGGGGPKKTLHPVEQVDVQGTGRTELVLKIEDLSLATVLVTRNGSPVGGVEAWLEKPQRGPGPGGMDMNRGKGNTTNADGRTFLEPKEPGKYILVVRAGRQAPQVRTDVELTIGQQEFEVEIPGAIVVGNLFADNRPMVGASLSLERYLTDQEGVSGRQNIAIMVVDNGGGPVMEMASGNPNDASAVSDRKGDFRFVDVPAGNWVVKCRAKGFARWTSDVFAVGEGKDVDLGTHRLQKGASLSGADASYDPESTGRSMFGLNSLIMLRTPSGAGIDICMTGEDGRYSFKDLAPGSYTVTHGDYTSEVLEIQAGEQVNHDLPKK